jgi:hypothetical protein
MNDEDFARQAFAAAFRSGPTGEPPTLPDVELLAQHGRRANRNRHGLYAAGSTVLAGAAVAGIVTGPTLLGLGSPSPSDVGTGAQGTTTPPSSPAPSSSSSTPDPAKPSPGVPCATPATINWLSVVNGALPTGVTATADHAANCVQVPDGSRTVEALFKLSTGTVELQVNVGTGPDIARKAGAAQGMVGISPASESPSDSLNPAAITSLQASKMAAAAAGDNSASAAGKQSAPPSLGPSLDAAAIASLEAQKQAIASAQATASPAPGAGTGDGIKGVNNQSCSKVGADEDACVSHLTKGTLSVVDVQLMRTGGAALIVDVAASNGKDLSVPESGQLPSDATMLALAQAVAAHF